MTRNTQDQIFDWKVIANILWQFTIISAIGWTAFSAPLSFIWSTPLTVSDGYIDAVISSVFIIDIIINFRNRNSEIESKVVSIDNWDKEPIPYNKTVWFPLDIFASIPFDLIVLSFGLGSTHKYLSLLRLFRVVRCLKIISIIKDAPKTLKMTMIVAGALTIIHWIACGWISINHLQGADIITIYNKAIYWAITTLTTIGYGDITPKTNLGRSYTMIIMILGVGTYGVVIGNVSRMIMLADKSKEERKEKFNDLNLFMKHYKIPSNLQKQVFSFYGHLLNKNLGESETKILGDLPAALKNELEVYKKIKLIKTVPIFQDCTIPCLKMVAIHLKQKVYSPHNTIVKAGDLGQEMYIIAHGDVEVVVDNKPVAGLKAGQYFGEIALIEETVRNADIRSVSYCDLYVFEKEDFLKIIEKYPALEDKFTGLYQRRTTDKKSHLKKVA